MKACTALASSLALLAACGAEAEPAFVGDGELGVRVAPLDLGAEVADAIFAVTVYDYAGHEVWHAGAISAAAYGMENGVHYVGPCDSQARPYSVHLVLLQLIGDRGQIIPPTDYYNPTSPQAPLIRAVACGEDVTFDIDLARDEDEGFFDIGVKFDEVFCSAAVDCRDDQGQPLKLLFPESGGQRAETVVFGLACASRRGATWLHLEDIIVECNSGPHELNPTGEEGNAGPIGNALFQTAIYAGSQVSGDDQVCYWNAALGIRVGDDARYCRLKTRATATNMLWAGNLTPAGKIYPYVDVDVQLTDDDGQILCGHHPIAMGGGVTIAYTDGVQQQHFERSRSCGFQTVPFPRAIECDGALGGDDVVFTDEGAGRFTVQFGDDTMAAPLTLPIGTALTSCCGNPCCSD